jgi:hypothetical protein
VTRAIGVAYEPQPTLAVRVAQQHPSRLDRDEFIRADPHPRSINSGPLVLGELEERERTLGPSRVVDRTAQAYIRLACGYELIVFGRSRCGPRCENHLLADCVASCRL